MGRVVNFQELSDEDDDDDDDDDDSESDDVSEDSESDDVSEDSDDDSHEFASRNTTQPITVRDTRRALGSVATRPPSLPGVVRFQQQAAAPRIASQGLIENWHRVYDSVIGRYLQQDPLGLHMAGSYEGLNQIYAYAENSPLMLIDAEGLAATKGCKPQGPYGNQVLQINSAAGKAEAAVRTCLDCDARKQGDVKKWIAKIRGTT